MKKLALLFVFWCSPALATVDLTWAYVENPILCDQNSSCDVQIIIERQPSSTEDWPVKNICDTGFRISLPGELSYTPLTRVNNAVCASTAILTASEAISEPILVGRISDPGTASVQSYEISMTFDAMGSDSTAPLSSAISTVTIQDTAMGSFAYHWPLNETSGTTANDLEGGQNGAVSGDFTWEEGTLTLGGTNAFVDFPELTLTDAPFTGISTSGWFRPDLLTNCAAQDCRLISWATGTSTANHHWMLSTVDGGTFATIRIRIKIDGTTETVQGNAGTPLVDDQWYHVVVTYDGIEIKAYINNDPVVFTTSAAFAGEVAEPVGVDAAIGANPGSPPERYFEGRFSEWKHWTDRALTPSEVEDLFNLGSGQSDTPVFAVDDASTTTTNSPVTIPVLANDQGTPPLAIDSCENPPAGTSLIVGTQVQYTPDLDVTGVDTFNCTVSNSLGTDIGLVTVTVNAPGAGFAALNCADAQFSGLRCETYEVDIGAPDAYRCAANDTAPSPFCPEQAVFDGEGRLRFTFDGSLPQDIGGVYGLDFTPNLGGWVHVAYDLYITQAYVDSHSPNLWNGSSGDKHVLIADTKSCTNQAMNMAMAGSSMMWAAYHSCGPGVRSHEYMPGPVGSNYDIQPVEGVESPVPPPPVGSPGGGLCTSNTRDAGSLDGCYRILGDTWHRVEVAIHPPTKRMIYYMEGGDAGAGTLIMDWTAVNPVPSGFPWSAAEPYNHARFEGYKTGYGVGASAPPSNAGNTYEWYYDNIGVSYTCIHGIEAAVAAQSGGAALTHC